jgi:hypothetical protein
MRWGRVVVLGFAVSAMSCLAPTEIILVLSTDVACKTVTDNGIAIALGAPGDEDSGIATTTKLCSDDGGIGSLTLLPHGSVDQPIGIRVTLGVDAAADNCGPNFAGCIVARRSLRFDPHTPLTLPIDLDQACIGVPCTPDSTCVSGACVDAGVECNNASCGIADAGVDAPIDAGACQNVPDVVVKSGSGGAPARVALSNDGWAVAYQTPQLGVELADVHLSSGGTTNISTIPLVQSNTALTLGPLGGDRSSYALEYTTSNGALVLLADLNGVAFTNPYSFTGYTLSTYGMPALGSNTYAGALIQPPNSDPMLQIFTPTTNGGNSGNITASNLADITMAAGASTTYVTTADRNGTCFIYTCAHQQTFTCTESASSAPGCVAIRVAERLGVMSHVDEAAKGTLTVDANYQLAAPAQGTAFQMIATRDAFQIVYVTQVGGLILAKYDGKNTPTVQSLFLTAGTVLGVDVVADGPNEPGFSIAYTMSDGANTNSVHFLHFCQ